jgi:signal transduction histidine kinase
LHAPDLSPQNRQRLNEVRESLQAAQLEIRSFAYYLHQADLGGVSLVKALQRFCDGFGRRSGLAIAVSVKDLPDALPPEVEHALFRVCQEAIMNVHRHANACSVEVRLAPFDGHLVMSVHDDGQGVDGPHSFTNGGMGVGAMRARMLNLGGDLSLRISKPGITVIARVPINGRRRIDSSRESPPQDLPVAS